MRLSDLLAVLPSSSPRPIGADPEITRITADSRQVIPGALFVAIKGDQADGHRFIPDALARGAAAIASEGELAFRFDEGSASEGLYLTVPNARAALGWLSAAWHGFPSRQLRLIGVTGTDGKTTTASLIRAILQAAGLKTGLISTVSADIGDETLDTGFHVTTPDAPEVQGYLARMVQAGLKEAVLEVTSHGLAQHRVTGCEFDVAVVTNVTHEHLDYHKTYENYLAAKGRLFEMLSETTAKPARVDAPAVRTGVLNLDDRSYPYLASILHEKRIAYSLTPPTPYSPQLPQLWAADIRDTPAGLAFRAVSERYSFPVKTSLAGRFNLSNCLAAIAATVSALDLPPEAAQRGLAAFAGVPGRMERIDAGQPFTALVDFAHTPNALRRALEAACQMAAGGRIIAVFGSAGLRDVGKRWLMAEVAAQLADITVLTAEDPRTESLDAILETMAEGARSKGAMEHSPQSAVPDPSSPVFYRIPDRAEAIRFAVGLARPGDVVIACGKGHEQSMCFGTVEYAWDDRTAMRAALADLLGRLGPEMPCLPTSA